MDGTLVGSDAPGAVLASGYYLLSQVIMPNRSLHPCHVPGCTQLVAAGQACPRHPRPKAVDLRPNAAERGYNYTWVKARKAWLVGHPYCADPFGIHQGEILMARIVDHIIPRRLGGKDEPTNYQSLCSACHNRKTAQDGSRLGRGAKKL